VDGSTREAPRRQQASRSRDGEHESDDGGEHRRWGGLVAYKLERASCAAAIARSEPATTPPKAGRRPSTSMVEPGAAGAEPAGLQAGGICGGGWRYLINKRPTTSITAQVTP